VLLVVVPDRDDAAEEGALALAHAAAARGFEIVLFGRDVEVLGRAAHDLRAGGAQVAVFTGDPRVDDDRRGAIEMIEELFGAS
jgi:hypothetical protein